MNEHTLNMLLWLGNIVIAMLAAPLLIGIINKIKAFFAAN